MTDEFIKTSRDNRVATVRIERASKRNAFNQGVILELTRAAQLLHEDDEVVAVVIAGTEDCFSAGIDLKDPKRWDIDGLPLREQRHIMQRGRSLAILWETLPQITIAAIEGYAIGAGCALALTCDWRVIADDAYLWLPEVQHGLTLGWGALPRLVNLVGPALAKRLIILGDRVSAREAQAMGLVDWVAPKGNALALALSYARKVAQLPTAPVTMTKESVNAIAGILTSISSFMEPDQANLLRKGRDQRKT